MLLNESAGHHNRPPADDDQELSLVFRVSLNEEHAFLVLCCGGQPVIDLGERAHHYCLLTLARRRLDDAAKGLDSSSQGWIEIAELSKMLGLEPAHLNIQIFRARTQLKRALPRASGRPELVERRRGEARLGAVTFRIVRGAQLEGELRPHADGWAAFPVARRS